MSQAPYPWAIPLYCKPDLSDVVRMFFLTESQVHGGALRRLPLDTCNETRKPDPTLAHSCLSACARSARRRVTHLISTLSHSTTSTGQIPHLAPAWRFPEVSSPTPSSLTQFPFPTATSCVYSNPTLPGAATPPCSVGLPGLEPEAASLTRRPLYH